MKDALKKIEDEFFIKTSSYDNVISMINDVIDNKIDFMLMDKASYDVILNLDTTIDKDKLKVIYESDLVEEKNVSSEVKETFNIYVAGKDFAGLIDYNAIITVNTNTHEILLTSIPRDYYMEISGTNGKKDSLSHMYAYGTETSKKSLENLLGITLDYDINRNTESLVDLVDAVGGITYCSDQAYTTTHALIQNDYNDSSKKKLYVKKGCQELNGIETLTVARERNAFVGRDRVRQQNCQKIIIAIFNKLKTTNSIVNYNEILTSLENTYETSIPRELITSISKDTIDGAEWKFITQSVDGTDTNDAYISILNDYGFAMIPDTKSVDNARNKINTLLEEK